MSAIAHGSGRLPQNVMHFARLLRRAGLAVGPGQVLDAIAALDHVDLGRRSDVHVALRSVMAVRRDQWEVFDAAFSLFWRNPDRDVAEAMMAALEGLRRAPQPARSKPGHRRAAEAFAEASRCRTGSAPEAEKTRIDALLAVSDQERLRRMDFEAMGEAEIRAARQAIARLRLPLDSVPSRRFRPDRQGPRADLRETLRKSLRGGGVLVEIARRERRRRTPPLVALCDISGSMGRFAPMLLHFLHTVASTRTRTHVFLFGTRLTNITRALRHRDPEAAFAMVAALVPDWSGGTRIGEAIGRFNKDWARRVLGQGAVVLLITDGLDRDAGAGLAEAMDRLHRSCRRLIWLNPLLRYEGFEPLASGIRAMLPHVDDFRPAHNIESLEGLVRVLSAPAQAGRTAA